MNFKVQTFILGLIFLCLNLGLVFAGSPPDIVMVPGTFNSTIPGSEQRRTPYFGETILSTLEETTGSKVWVVEDLLATASFEENGERVASFLEENVGSRPFWLIAHSAGSFYVISAIKNHPHLRPIGLISISTPWNGSELADSIESIPWLGPKLEEMINKHTDWIDLRGFSGLTSKSIRRFLKTANLPPHFTIVSISGHQPAPDLFSSMAVKLNSKFLSPPLAILSGWLKSPSDGIVSVDSTKTFPISPSQSPPIDFWASNLTLDLEHPEQAFDPKVFIALKIKNTSHIQHEQTRAYSWIGRCLKDSAGIASRLKDCF